MNEWTLFQVFDQRSAKIAQKMKFSIEDFFNTMWPQFLVDLVTFTEEILNGKLHFLRSEK